MKERKKKSKESKKHEHNSLSDDSNDSWSIGLGSTGELLHLADVENKFKKLNIKSYNPTDPIKTTPLENNSTFLEQK